MRILRAHIRSYILQKRSERDRGCIWLGDRSNLNRNRPFQWKTFPVFMWVCVCVCFTVVVWRYMPFASFDWCSKIHISSHQLHIPSVCMLKDEMQHNKNGKLSLTNIFKFTKRLNARERKNIIFMKLQKWNCFVCLCMCVKQCGKKNIHLHKTTDHIILYICLFAIAIKTEIAT